MSAESSEQFKTLDYIGDSEPLLYEAEGEDNGKK